MKNETTIRHQTSSSNTIKNLFSLINWVSKQKVRYKEKAVLIHPTFLDFVSKFWDKIPPCFLASTNGKPAHVQYLGTFK